MSYVAEPYQFVTDQVLTALTGGVARETHRFFAGANAFSFEKGADAVIPESVRAIGQANGNYTDAAKILGVHPNHLFRLIRTLNLKVD